MQRWYVVEAFEGKDEDAWLRLVCSGFAAWRPVRESRVSARARGATKPARRISRIPVFGRYIFLRAEEIDVAKGFVVSAVKAVRSVHDFVHLAGSNEPAALPEGLVEFYRSVDFSLKVEKTIAINVGASVAMRDGPFVGHVGKVDRIDSRGVMLVALALFGRSTPIICTVDHVELREQGQRPPMQPALNGWAAHEVERRRLRSHGGVRPMAK